MKKVKLIATLGALAMVAGAVTGCGPKGDTVRLGLHLNFGAGAGYSAIAQGYFEEEGLDVEIILTSGADKVTAAVLSGDVQIGFCGSESTIYNYNQGNKDYLINFAGLTKKDGSFLVAREKTDNFKLEDLKEKHIIGGRKGLRQKKL